MKFPKRIKHRRFEATIYGKSASRPYYRLAFYAAGKRHIRNFRAYSEAKTEAERVVRQLADGSQADALNAAQSRDALAAIERLAELYRATGRRVSLLAVASEYVESVKKLNGRTLAEAIDGFLSNVVTVIRPASRPLPPWVKIWRGLPTPDARPLHKPRGLRLKNRLAGVKRENDAS